MTAKLNIISQFMTQSAFSTVAMAPSDPILGLTEIFKADSNSSKVNLGVGVYYDNNGKVPLLECVKSAESALVGKNAARAYQPIDGNAEYNLKVQELLLGAGSTVITDGRIVTAQTLGGTGALKVGADFLRNVIGTDQVWISNPTWANHKGIFQNAGFTVNTYPYYDESRKGVDFDAMIGKLSSLPKNSVVLLHACCHNPTGVDLTKPQWDEIATVVLNNGLIPFLDIAYQGFGDSIDDDAYAVRLFVERCPNVLIANSFSKSFSLYGERIGGLSVVSGSKDESARVLSQVKTLIRTNYSNPPIHGGGIVGSVLRDSNLRGLWDQELAGMRDRIKLMRSTLAKEIMRACPDHDFSFIEAQRGMFSYSGLQKPQVDKLRADFSIYVVDSGRICVAALNSQNVGYVAEAISKVLK